MGFWKIVRRPPWRTIVPGIVFLGLIALAYPVWQPGKDIRDGRHDLGKNGIWLQHGWLADDAWFTRNQRTNQMQFRSPEKVKALAAQLRTHHITDVYSHLCPASLDGSVPSVDDRQTELFLTEFKDFHVMPWVGGVFGEHALPHREKWRRQFVASIQKLLQEHPHFAGIHINIEPWPSGNTNFIQLLLELRRALPEEKLISIAAYPPPTRWHPFPDLHWEESYFREIAKHADDV